MIGGKLRQLCYRMKVLFKASRQNPESRRTMQQLRRKGLEIDWAMPGPQVNEKTGFDRETQEAVHTDD